MLTDTATNAYFYAFFFSLTYGGYDFVLFVVALVTFRKLFRIVFITRHVYCFPIRRQCQKISSIIQRNLTKFQQMDFNTMFLRSIERTTENLKKIYTE